MQNHYKLDVKQIKASHFNRLPYIYPYASFSATFKPKASIMLV
jgi:hypothetical protein